MNCCSKKYTFQATLEEKRTCNFLVWYFISNFMGDYLVANKNSAFINCLKASCFIVRCYGKALRNFLKVEMLFPILRNRLFPVEIDALC